MIGVIMMARMRPAVKNDEPLTGGPNRLPSTGTPSKKLPIDV